MNDKYTLYKFRSEEKIEIGCLLAIKNNRGIYCRGKVVKYYPYNGGIQYEIELIDFATFVLANFDDLRQLGDEFKVYKEVPPQVIRCTLTELQPAIVKSHRGDLFIKIKYKSIILIDNFYFIPFRTLDN